VVNNFLRGKLEVNCDLLEKQDISRILSRIIIVAFLIDMLPAIIEDVDYIQQLLYTAERMTLLSEKAHL